MPRPDPMPAILAELAISNAKGRPASNSQTMPATRALLDDAAAALARGIPARFDHGGRTFFLRVSLGLARLEVFDTPASAEPLCLAMHGSFDTHGHTPGH
jgi:hypothetical protein